MLASFLRICRRALAGLVVVAAAVTGPAHGAEPDAPYRIQPGDILVVSVWREPELQSEVTVRPDGWVSLPLAGDISAAGGSVEDLRKAIDGRLRAKYMPDPVVTVSVKAVAGSRIYVVGKVQNPGEFLLNRPIDVMQALALAGGATPFADVNDIRILRRSGERQIALRFRYGDTAAGKRLDQNILLQAGDTVVVP